MNSKDVLDKDPQNLSKDSLQSIKDLENIETIMHSKEDNKNKSISRHELFSGFDEIYEPISHIIKVRSSIQRSTPINQTQKKHAFDEYKNNAQNVKKQSYDIDYIKTKEKIYISCGDINGIGLELILRNHFNISKYCEPIYCVSMDILQQASQLLQIEIPKNIVLENLPSENIQIQPAQTREDSGKYSFDSFNLALECSLKNNAKLLTMPINKYAWNLAGIKYAGHTEFLRDRFNSEAIMMLGCSKLFVALFSDHIALKDVPARVNKDSITNFLLNFHNCILNLSINKEKSLFSKILQKDSNKIAVLGLNPHAGDNGIIGREDLSIKEAIDSVNLLLDREIFYGPITPDSAFIPSSRERFQVMIAMYHDVGLAPLKALYFDESINVSLNLPIIRVSPDHGVAFDIAYKNSEKLNSNSYLESIKFCVSS